MNKKKKAVFSIVANEDEKFYLARYLSLQDIITEGPCIPLLVKAIKLIPENMLLWELDPNTSYNVEDTQKRFTKLIQFIYKSKMCYGVINFLEDCGFITYKKPSKEEAKRFLKNERRRKL
jgi:hypothetical protein